MVTGSVAAAYHGAPRATFDIDLVIDATEDQLHRVVAALTAAGLYASDAAALEASRLEGMFNVVDPASSWKVDLIVRKSRPFSRVEFGRRLPFVFESTALAVASLEDVILAKLEWARRGGSARQLEDVASLLALRSADVDRGYLEHWVRALGVAAEWQAAERLVTQMPPETSGAG
jgi:hypothetical protein